MARWLVRFGYDGAPFAGWARQPDKVTVEGTILRGWAREASPATLELRVASRTDRGVSATGNALSLHSPLPGRLVLRRLNGIDPNLFFTAATPIPDEFRVRSARRRVYRYCEANEPRSLERWQQAARALTGRLDVRSFGRALPLATPTWRDVESVRIGRADGGLRIEVAARSFVWGMVRKMISALRWVDQGRLDLAQLERAVAGTERLNLPLAEPEGLVLRDVQYDVPWTIPWEGPHRHQRAAFVAERDALSVRSRVLEELEGVFSGGTPQSADR